MVLRLTNALKCRSSEFDFVFFYKASIRWSDASVAGIGGPEWHWREEEGVEATHQRHRSLPHAAQCRSRGMRRSHGNGIAQRIGTICRQVCISKSLSLPEEVWCSRNWLCITPDILFDFEFFSSALYRTYLIQKMWISWRQPSASTESSTNLPTHSWWQSNSMTLNLFRTFTSLALISEFEELLDDIFAF